MWPNILKLHDTAEKKTLPRKYYPTSTPTADANHPPSPLATQPPGEAEPAPQQQQQADARVQATEEDYGLWVQGSGLKGFRF